MMPPAFFRAPEPCFALLIREPALRSCRSSETAVIDRMLATASGQRRGLSNAATGPPLTNSVPYLNVMTVSVAEENATPVSTRRA